MKFGIRTPSLKRRFAARTSLKRVVRHNLGLKAPRGFGIITNPKKAIYNKVYNKTSVSVDRLLSTSNTKNSNNSLLISTVIFVVLGIIYFPLAIVFVVYKVYKSRKKKTLEGDAGENESNLVVKDNQKTLVGQFNIPEPTKSLLWITDEDTSKISSPMSIRINIDIGSRTANVDDGHNFYGEPSLIWSRLPVEPNSELEEKPMYYPSYSGLSSKHRFQYLKWLQDVTQPTNLSYVFLYYYGLERHMLVGDFDSAVKEILRLLKHHNKGSFKSYATTALIAACAFRKRPEVVTDSPFLFEEPSNESLILKKMAGKPLLASDIVGMAYKVGFKNKRYTKLYPEIFNERLQKNIDEFEKTHGNILDAFDIKKLPKIRSGVFANMSLPSDVRAIEIPDLIGDEDFCNTLFQLLQETHDEIKITKTKE